MARQMNYIKASESIELDVLTKQFEGKKSVYLNGILYRPYDLSTLRIGQDNDDFVRDIFTVICDRKVYRVPRILNRVYA